MSPRQPTVRCEWDGDNLAVSVDDPAGGRRMMGVLDRPTWEAIAVFLDANPHPDDEAVTPELSPKIHIEMIGPPRCRHCGAVQPS